MLQLLQYLRRDARAVVCHSEQKIAALQKGVQINDAHTARGVDAVKNGVFHQRLQNKFHHPRVQQRFAFNAVADAESVAVSVGLNHFVILHKFQFFAQRTKIRVDARHAAQHAHECCCHLAEARHAVHFAKPANGIERII